MHSLRQEDVALLERTISSPRPTNRLIRVLLIFDVQLSLTNHKLCQGSHTFAHVLIHSGLIPSRFLNFSLSFIVFTVCRLAHCLEFTIAS